MPSPEPASIADQTLPLVLPRHEIRDHTNIDNRLGLVTRFTYRASTVGFIDDEQHGRPWVTRLPFPVHVVEQVEHVEQFTGTRSVTRYAYHHGAWDPLEREFRGFGMVEQTDADEYEESADSFGNRVVRIGVHHAHERGRRVDETVHAAGIVNSRAAVKARR